MDTQTNLHLDAASAIESSAIAGTPTLQLRPGGTAYGGVSIFLGNSGRPGEREAIIAQLRALHAAVADMAHPYGGLSAILGPDDEPTDEPDDEPAAPTGPLCQEAGPYLGPPMPVGRIYLEPTAQDCGHLSGQHDDADAYYRNGCMAPAEPWSAASCGCTNSMDAIRYLADHPPVGAGLARAAVLDNLPPTVARALDGDR